MTVYRIKSPNDKCYIGVTKDFKKRMREHKCAANTNCLYNNLYDDIRFFGWESFDKRILNNFDDKFSAYNFEQEIIKKYKENNIKLYNEYTNINGKYARKSRLTKEDRKKIGIKKTVNHHKKTGHYKIAGSKGGQSMKKKEKPTIVIDKLSGNTVGIWNHKLNLAKDLGVGFQSIYRYLNGERCHKDFYFEEVSFGYE